MPDTPYQIIRNQFKIKLLVIFILSIATSIYSYAASTSTQLDLTVENSYFDYREYSSRQRELNRESGILPALGLALQYSKNKWQINADILARNNKLKYDGELQSGLDYQTKTKEFFYQATIQASLTEFLPFSPIIGAGYWFWKRDIQPGAIITPSGKRAIDGLQEEYRWSYIELGLKLNPNRFFSNQTSTKTRHHVIFAWTNPFDAEMVVFLPNGKTKVEPRPEPGYYASYQLSFDAVQVSLYHQRWEFDRSDAVNGIFEPDNEMTLTGLKLHLRIY